MAFSLSDYEIAGTIGSGGFGTVYRARQKSLGRTVAIKCLAPQRIQNRDEIIRFRREAEAMAALAHENIIGIFDYAYAGGNYYIVMEYVDGTSFGDAISGKIPIDISVYIMEKVAGALRCAHEKNIVHRDLKPANIFLGVNGQVKLADFGLASFLREMTSQSGIAAVGTLAYMAPEVMVSPGEIDTRADIFSFGCILYEILSGAVPFAGNSLADVSYKVLNAEPAPLSPDRMYKPVASIALQCLAKDRERRPSMEDLHNVLRSMIKEHTDVSSDTLAAFVKKGTKKTGVSSSSAVTEVQPVTKKIYTRKYSAIAAVVFTAFCIALILFTIPRLARKPQPQKTSSFSMIQKEYSSDQSLSTGTSQDKRGARMSQDGPKPLTGGGEAENKTGALIIGGIRPGDTVVVNDKRVDVPDTSSGFRMPVATGHYRIEVRRSGRIFRKELEIMPYQIVRWNAEK